MRLYTSHISNRLPQKYAPKKIAQKVVRSTAHPVLLGT